MACKTRFNLIFSIWTCPMWQEYVSFLHCVSIRQNVSRNRHFNNVKNVFYICTSQSLFLHEWQSWKNSIRTISFSFRLCLWIWNHDLLTYFSVTDYVLLIIIERHLSGYILWFCARKMLTQLDIKSQNIYFSYIKLS